jgi:hypothetical protein
MGGGRGAATRGRQGNYLEIFFIHPVTHILLVLFLDDLDYCTNLALF